MHDPNDNTQRAIDAVREHRRNPQALWPHAPPTGISEARWHAMLKQIKLYGPPEQPQDFY